MTTLDWTVVEWQELATQLPDNLSKARDQLHWGARLVASAGTSLLAPKVDDSHTNMAWLPDFGGILAGHNTIEGFGVALNLKDFKLLLRAKNGDILQSLPLHGHTFEQALLWLAGAVSEATGTATNEIAEPTTHQLPAHAIGQGQPFSFEPPEAFAEIDKWYANAGRILTELQSKTANASPVRCWPHHFDIATLISLEPGEDPEKARSIGVGMTPGDDSYAEPYWYVAPWPVPEKPKLSPLRSDGAWHRQGWLGAVLTGSHLVRHRASSSQAQRLVDFLNSGVEACHALLGR